MSWQKYFRALGLGLGFLLFMREIWRVGGLLIERRLYFPGTGYLLLGASLVSASAYFVQILSWNMIMRYIGVPLSPRHAVEGYPITFLPRYIPGSIWGYWSRSEWLKESYSISYADSFLASSLEIALFALTALFLVTSGMAFYSSGVKRVVLGSISGGLIILMGEGIPRLIFKIRQHPSYQIAPCIRSWYMAVALSVLLLYLHGSTVYLTSLAVWPASPIDLIGATYITSLAIFLGFVCIFVPAGIGVREVILSSALVNRFGLPPEQASLIAIAFRFWVILAEMEWIVVGLISYRHVWWGKFLKGIALYCRRK